jgi:hypothetical protein
VISFNAFTHALMPSKSPNERYPTSTVRIPAHDLRTRRTTGELVELKDLPVNTITISIALPTSDISALDISDPTAPVLFKSIEFTFLSSICIFDIMGRAMRRHPVRSVIGTTGQLHSFPLPTVVPQIVFAKDDNPWRIEIDATEKVCYA